MHIKKSKGFTLSELMLGLLISSILIIALLSFFTTNVSYYKNTININRLNLQLQTVLDLMTNEIRRAGYWANASTDIGNSTTNANPFMQIATDIQTPLTNCILLTYNSTGGVGVADTEKIGFRLNGGAIQGRPPTGPANFTCAAANNTWENVTDKNLINISNLTFTITSTALPLNGTKVINVRTVTISITGNLISNNAVSATLTQFVRVRNDKYTP